MKQIRKRLTYANVMSTIAVFLLIGGGAAYAAIKLPKNSVGSKQLKKNAVNSSKVKNHSLLAADFKTGQLPAGPKGEAGPAGPKGATGLTGPKGETGPAGTALAYATVTSGGELVPSQSKGIEASDVARDSAGTYCFSHIPAEATSAIAQVYTSGETNTEADQFAAIGFAVEGSHPNWTGCSSSDVVRVTIHDVSGAALADHEFTIWFEG